MKKPEEWAAMLVLELQQHGLAIFNGEEIIKAAQNEVLQSVMDDVKYRADNTFPLGSKATEEAFNQGELAAYTKIEGVCRSLMHKEVSDEKTK